LARGFHGDRAERPDAVLLRGPGDADHDDPGIHGEIAGEAGAPTPGAKLEGQLRRWATARGGADPPPPGVLKLGVLAWSRLHGIASLELAGILGDMELDAGLLAQAEIDDLVASASGR
jgi:hypothetical protein